MADLNNNGVSDQNKINESNKSNKDNETNEKVNIQHELILDNTIDAVNELKLLMKQLASEVNETKQYFKTELDKFNKIKEDVNDSIKKSLTRFNKLVAESRDVINSNMKTVHKDLSDQNTQIVDLLENLIDQAKSVDKEDYFEQLRNHFGLYNSL